MKQRRFVAVAVLVAITLTALLIGCGGGGGGVTPPPASGLQKIADDAVAGGVPGVVLAVYTPTGGLQSVASGSGNLTPASAMSVSDYFRVGSITKSFVAAVMLQLVQAGTVTLDDTVEHWKPGLVPNGANITIRELLNHTSGLFEYLDDSTLQSTEIANRATIWAPQQLVAVANSHTPYFAPGASGQWHYSSTNYIIAGLIIEQATGNTIGSEIATYCTGPVGLANTSFVLDASIPSPYAHGYTPYFGAGTHVDVTSVNQSVAWAAGAIAATAADVVKWSRALLEQATVLPSARLTDMLTFVPTGTAGEQYGLGIDQITTTSGYVMRGHNGDTAGYSSAMFYDPSRQVTVVVLINSDTVGTVPDDLVDKVMKLVAP